MKVITEMCCAH